MRVTISICSEKSTELANLLGKADKKSPEYRKVLFELDVKEQKVTFVSGNALLMGSLVVNSVEINDVISNDLLHVSFDADILLDVLSRRGLPLEILLQYDTTDRVEMTFPRLAKYRRALGKEVEAVHIDYLSALEQGSMQQYDKYALVGLIQLVDKQCRPFECVLLNSEKDGGDSVKVQRDGEVFSERLDTKTHLGLEICLDKNTINTLEDICESSSEKTIGLRVEHDKIIFQSKDRITSVSIPDHSEFLSKVMTKKETVISFLLNAYQLKAELSSYVGINDIKQQEQSYLLISKSKLIVCAKTKDSEGADIVKLIDSSSNANDLVLMVNLHLFKELKVKDATEFHKSKASITKSVEGEYSFSFFHSTDPHHPFFSVPCISAPSHLSEVKELYQRLKKQLADQQEKPNQRSNEQLDLVGFGELLDV